MQALIVKALHTGEAPMGRSNRTYATAFTATGGRERHAVIDDCVLDVQLRRPTLNRVSDGTSPKQLFAAVWGGCFQSALMAIARKSRDDVSGCLWTSTYG
jgi:lipoyl-dependent peroxiredoxin